MWVYDKPKTHLRITCAPLEDLHSELGLPTYRAHNVRSFDIILRAMQMRVETCKGKPQPRVSTRAVDKTLAPFLTALRSYDGAVRTKDVEDIVFGADEQEGKSVYVRALQSWLDGATYKTKTKNGKVYLVIDAAIKEEKSLHEESVNDASEGKLPQNKDPRMIMPPDPIYRMLLMRHFGKEAEHKIVDIVDSILGYKCVMKGMNLDQIGDTFLEHWNHVSQFGKPVYVAFDCSRFDAHFNRTVAKKVYQALSDLSDEPAESHRLLWLLLNLYVRCGAKVGNDYYSYKKYLKHTILSSGVPITSVAAILLVCAVLYNLRSEDVRIVDMGDDFGVITTVAKMREIQKMVQELFDSVGQEVVAEEPIYIFENISFCQHSPVLKVRGGARMMPDLIRLAKDTYNLSTIRPKDWLKSVGVCGLSWAANSCFKPFYQLLIALGNGGKDRKLRTYNGRTLWADIDQDVTLDRGSLERRYPGHDAIYQALCNLVPGEVRRISEPAWGDLPNRPKMGGTHTKERSGMSRDCTDGALLANHAQSPLCLGNPIPDTENHKSQALSNQESLLVMKKSAHHNTLQSFVRGRSKPTIREHEAAVKCLEDCGCSSDGAKAILDIVDPTGINHNPSRRPMGYPSSDGTNSVNYEVQGSTVLNNFSIGEDPYTKIGILFNPIQNYADHGPDVTWDFPFVVGGTEKLFGSDQRAHLDTENPRRSAVNRFRPSLLTIMRETEDENFGSCLSTGEYRNHSSDPELDFKPYMPPNRLSRVVGGYLKIRDLTPPLYQTGTVCTWRKNAEFEKASYGIQVTPGANSFGAYVGTSIAAPPRNIAEAKLLGGNQWSLKEGALITLRPSGPNEPTKAKGDWSVFATNDKPVGELLLGLGQIQSAFHVSDAYTNVPEPAPVKLFTAFDQQGIYIEGATENTVLGISWKLDFEVFPRPGDETLTLATPSLPTDARAIEIMEEILRDLPYGVPAHENALGDWFRSVASKVLAAVQRYGPGILDAVSIANPALAPAAQVAKQALRLRKKRERAKK